MHALECIGPLLIDLHALERAVRPMTAPTVLEPDAFASMANSSIPSHLTTRITFQNPNGGTNGGTKSTDTKKPRKNGAL